MSSHTAFVPFRYCPLCRLNHKKGKKHVFSQKHQDIVTKILSKFSKKITEAKELLKKPSVKDVTWDQAGLKFWCYFCQEDVNKHRLNMSMFGQCVVELGGFLEHIARNDHADKTAAFLKENKLDMKRTSEFIISTKVYLKYLEDVESAASQFFMQKSQVTARVASQIRSQAAKRQNVVANSVREQSQQQQNRQQSQSLAADTRWPKSNKGLAGSEEKGKKTVQAFGEGLTAIERIHEDDSAGNIYTNAVPPWIQADVGTETSLGVIGPTLEDLEKHKKLELKKQLPACRVGAKFDHKSNETKLWLPDFGGVWNHGRRTKTVEQFLRRQKRKLDSHSSSSPPLSYSNHESASTVPTPYSFPRIASRTATVTSNSEKLADTSHVSSVTGSANVNLLNAAYTSQNVEFHYPQDSQTSAYDYVTSSERTSSLMCNTLNPASDFVEATGSVTVKPYVRKRKIASSPECEHSHPGLPASFLQAPLYYSEATDHMDTENNLSGAYGFSPVNTVIPMGNHLRSSGHDENLNKRGVEYQRSQWSGQACVSTSEQGLETAPLRLLATPVLSQPKSKQSSKVPFGAGGRGR